MKKILILLLLILLFVLDYVAIFKGINLFGIQVLSLEQIKEKNKELDYKIAQATTLASTEYPNALANIETNLSKLEQEKKNYDDMVTISTNEQVQLANQYQKYEIEYLWTIIGNHATKEGVVIKIDLVAASGENMYNLNFTVNGTYIGITEFISDIENDSALGFKIENFTMKPNGGTQTLQTTFTCKDIEIKDVSKSTASTSKTTKNSTNSNSQSSTNTTSNENNTDSTSNSQTSTTTDSAENNSTNSTSQSTTGNTSGNSTAGSTTNTTSSSTQDELIRLSN